MNVTKFYTIRECAEKIGVDYRTVERWIQAGKMEAILIGRTWAITEDELNFILNNYPPRKTK